MREYSNDDELADAVQAGDVAAQEIFFNRFQLTLIKVALSRRFSPADADDLAQDALVLGFRNIASFRRGESLEAWLVGIEWKLMLRHWAARRSEPLPLDDVEAEETVPIWEPRSAEEAKELGRLWAQTLLNMTLARNQQYMDAVRLRYIDRFSFAAIEDALGLGKNVAKVYVRRGLKVLKQMYEADAPMDVPREGGGDD